MKLLPLVALACLGFACQNEAPKMDEKAPEMMEPKAPEFQNEAHEIVYNFVQRVGDYDALKAMNDVVYTYKRGAGKSIEKYIFDGELSIGEYYKNDTLLYTQGYDGQEAWVKMDTGYVADSTMLASALFGRKTNFYWFAMMQKMLDPGMHYKYVKLDTVDSKPYHVIATSFTPINDKPTDIYQLYINTETGIADQFLFTVADYNMMDNPLLMRVTYNKFGEVMIPNQREFIQSNWEGDEVGENWNKFMWTDIKFDQGLQPNDFKKS